MQQENKKCENCKWLDFDYQANAFCKLGDLKQDDFNFVMPNLDFCCKYWSEFKG